MCTWNFVQIFCIFLLIWVTFSTWGVQKLLSLVSLVKMCTVRSIFTSGCKWILSYVPYLLSDLGEIQLKTSALIAVDHSWIFFPPFLFLPLPQISTVKPVLQNTTFPFLFHLYIALCLQIEDIVELSCPSH